MVATVTRNRYHFPPGYRKPGNGAAKYSAFNGSLIAASPARDLLGASQIYNIASVPANSSTFILNSPDGRSYTFQFLYGATAGTNGIGIPLPNSGSSTAAQVQSAMLAVMSQIGGFTSAGAFVSFPWKYQQTGAAQFTINWTVAGTAVVAGGTQATITAGAITASAFGVGGLVPGRFGKNYAFLPAS